MFDVHTGVLSLSDKTKFPSLSKLNLNGRGLRELQVLDAHNGLVRLEKSSPLYKTKFPSDCTNAKYCFDIDSMHVSSKSDSPHSRVSL